MEKSRLSDEQIIGVLQEHDCGGLQVSEAKRLKALEVENRRLE